MIIEAMEKPWIMYCEWNRDFPSDSWVTPGSSVNHHYEHGFPAQSPWETPGFQQLRTKTHRNPRVSKIARLFWQNDFRIFHEINNPAIGVLPFMGTLMFMAISWSPLPLAQLPAASVWSPCVEISLHGVPEPATARGMGPRLIAKLVNLQLQQLVG